MSAPTYQMNIVRGKTLEVPMLYAEARLMYVPIVSVSNRAPLRLFCPAHGIIDGWPVRIQGVVSPSSLNTPEGGVLSATVIDSNTIEINSIDASLLGDMDNTGCLVFQTPADLTGAWKMRMQVRDTPKGNVLLSFSSDVADGADGTITIDAAGSKFTVGLSAADSAALLWDGGVYDIEGITPAGKVVAVIGMSTVIVSDEITVWTP